MNEEMEEYISDVTFERNLGYDQAVAEGIFDAEFGEILKVFSEMRLRDDLSSAVILPNQVRKVSIVYGELRDMFKGRAGVRVSYELFKPIRTMGGVTITWSKGKLLMINNMRRFAAVARLADNFEVYSMANGETKLTLGFNGLMAVANGERGE